VTVDIEERPPTRPRPLDLLPVLAFAATFGVFFVDKSREARTVLTSWRGLLAVGVVVAGYAGVALVVRRVARRSWIAPVLLAAVVLGLAAWVVRPYYVDSTADRRLVADPVVTPPADAPAPMAQREAVPVVVATGSLAGLGHEASGTASLIRAPDGSFVVRLGGFDIEGVPDPRVYLVQGEDAERPRGGTDLGRLAGNRGTTLDIAVPSAVGAGPGWTVLVWCRAFSVPVANATLAAPAS